MSNKEGHVSSRWPGFISLYTWVAVILLFILLILWFLGYGPGGNRCAVSTMAAGPEIEAAPAPPPVVQRDEPTMPVPAPARLHFEVDGYAPPADSTTALQPILDYLEMHRGATAIVSGYHDPSGDLDYNQELAKERAQTVRDLLMRHGVSEERIVLLKPRGTTGQGPQDEARRVEVHIGNLD